MRTLPVPTILALIGASAAISAVEVAPAGQQLVASPAASLVPDKPASEAVPVNVAGLGVLPAGNLGSADGKMKINLKALVSGSYDSNVYATETNEKDDVYLRLYAGIEATYRLDDRIGFGAEVTADSLLFNEYSDRNLFGGQARVRAAYKGETTAGNVTLDYALVDDPLLQTGERLKRSTYGGKTVWLREALSGGILVNADAHRQEYLEDQGSFVAEDRNVNNYSGGVRYIHMQNERSSMWARVDLGADQYDTDNRFQDATSVSGAIGADLGFGDRATVSLEVGVDARSYTDEFAAGYDDEDVVAPLASLSLYYPMSERGGLITVRAFSDARNSVRSNAMQATGATVEAGHPLSEQLIATASVSGLRLTDYGSAVGQDASERDLVGASVGALYKLKDGIVLRATGRYTHAEAKLAAEADYSRFEGVIETAFAF
jgi:hypothetical protein